MMRILMMMIMMITMMMVMMLIIMVMMTLIIMMMMIMMIIYAQYLHLCLAEKCRRPIYNKYSILTRSTAINFEFLIASIIAGHIVVKLFLVTSMTTISICSCRSSVESKNISATFSVSSLSICSDHSTTTTTKINIRLRSYGNKMLRANSSRGYS